MLRLILAAFLAAPLASQATAQQQPLSPGHPPSSLIWTEQIEGAHVRSTTGEDLGKIDGVLLDRTNSSVAYVMIEVGGFLGVGQRLVALPWAALQPSPDGKTYVANVTSDVLKAAPSAESSQTAVIADPNWQQAVGAYWSQRAGLIPDAPHSAPAVVPPGQQP